MIGQYITRAIVANTDFFDRIVIFTSPETQKNKTEHLSKLAARGVKTITGDITSEEDVKRAYNGIDTIVSCLGRPAIHLQVQLIKWAEEHPDVRRILPSEYGTDIEYGPKSINEVPHQQKIKVRAALKECKKLEYTYVVTGPYADLYVKNYPGREEAGSFDMIKRKAVLLGDGNGKVSLTTMRDVGKLVVGALLHPEESRNKALRLNSYTTTNNSVLAEFEKQTGGQKWDVNYTSLEELQMLEKKAYDEKNPAASLFTLRRIWTEGGTLYEQRDNPLIGADHNMDTMKDTVQEAIEAQTAAS